MKLAHISMNARDADKLAAFYRNVCGCKELRPPRVLSGKEISRGNGLPNAEIYSIWLKLPEIDRPFLEIHEHKDTHNRPRPLVNEPGFGHLSFETNDIREMLGAVIEAGGSPVGEINNFGSVDRPYLIVYVRDPEGNILELEQPCDRPPI